MTGDLCPFCGAYATSACEFEDDTDNCPWEEVLENECSECGGSGVIAHRVTVYEAGCGFPHDDTDERPCPECSGPDPDLLREQRDENRRLAKEGGEDVW